MNAKQLIFGVLGTGIFLLLGGCATSTLKKDEAKELSHLTLYEFVQQRFVKEEEKPVSESITSFLSSVGDFLATSKAEKQRNEMEKRAREAEKRSIGLMPDGRSVVFKAYYGGLNNIQLKRPYTEMRLYCETSNGMLATVNLDRQNIVARAFDNPDAAYTRAMRQNYQGSVSMTLAGVTTTLPMNAYKREIAEYEADRVRQQNVWLDERFAKRGYDDARFSGAFGKFMCLRKGDKKALWQVEIIPVYFKSKQAGNDLSSHEMRVLIAPLMYKQDS